MDNWPLRIQRTPGSQTRSRRKPITVGAFLLVIATLPAAAQQAEPWVPSALDLPAGGISLGEASDLTLVHDPTLRIAESEVRFQKGVVEEARGLFDTAAVFFFTYQRAQGELLERQIEIERDKRLLQRTLADEFTRISDELQRQLDLGERLGVDCPSFILIVEGISVCVSDVDRANGQTFDEYLDLLIEQEDDPDLKAELEGVRDTSRELLEQTAVNVIRLLRQEAGFAEDRLEKLGAIPEIEERFSLLFDLRLRKLFRNGSELSIGTILEGAEDNFDGKSLLADLGGKGLPNTFTSFAGLSWDVPLGKGWGAKTTAAPERAAQLERRARTLALLHSVSQSVLRTNLAYWNLAANQERLQLLDDAVDIERELYQSAEDLVEADEIPRSTLARVQARVASARQEASEARQAVLEARIALANAIGVKVEAPEDAPWASESFPLLPSPDQLDDLDPQRLIGKALNRRFDVLSAAELEGASQILQIAAQRSLRRRLDLSLAVGYSGLHESFEDEYYDLAALGEALFGTQTGPSAFFSLTMDIPFRNRVARGQLRQATALTGQANIITTELQRQVQLNITELISTLREAAAEVARQEASVGFNNETLAATIENFKAGETTLFDAVLTEEQLTFARLRLVGAWQIYASLLSQLKFESGTLVSSRQEGDRISIPILHPYGFGLAE